MRPQLEHGPLLYLFDQGDNNGDGGQDHFSGQFGLLTAGSKTFEVFKMCCIFESSPRRFKIRMVVMVMRSPQVGGQF